MIVVQPVDTPFKKFSFATKFIILLSAAAVIVSIIPSLVIQSIGIPSTLCLPCADPTKSNTLITIILWFVVITQMITISSIITLHAILVACLQKSQKNLRKSVTVSNSALYVQLILLTLSPVVGWSAAGLVFIVAWFLHSYPPQLMEWAVVGVIPVNLYIDTFVFIIFAVKNVIC